MQQAAADLDAAEAAHRQARAERDAAQEAAAQAARDREAADTLAAQTRAERAALADASAQFEAERAAAQATAALASADKAAAELLAAQAASDKAVAEAALREATAKEAALEHAAAAETATETASAPAPQAVETGADAKLVVARPSLDAVTLTIGTNQVPFPPSQLSQLIEELAHARASMTTEQPKGLPAGWRFVSTRNPMMAVQKQANGDRLLVARHTGYGWVPFTFSPDTVIQMYMLLTQ
ncbi:hypothetical protein [Burkholderia sp. 3C]